MVCEYDFFPLLGGVDSIDGDVFGAEDIERRLLLETDESDVGARRSTTGSWMASSKPGGGVEQDGIPPGII